MNTNDIIQSGNVYDKLADDMSKTLYERSVEVYLGIREYMDFCEGLEMPKNGKVRGFDWIYDSFETNPNVIVYGAGKRGVFSYNEFKKSKYANKLKGLCDIRADYLNKTDTVHILLPEEAASIENTVFFLAADSIKTRFEMYCNLLRLGVLLLLTSRGDI